MHCISSRHYVGSDPQRQLGVSLLLEFCEEVRFKFELGNMDPA